MTFNDSNYVHGSALPHMRQPQNEEHLQLKGADARQDGVIQSPDTDTAADAATDVHSLALGLPQAAVHIEHCELFHDAVQAAPTGDEYFDAPAGEGEWLWQQQELQSRPRPDYYAMAVARTPQQLIFFSKIEESMVIADPNEAQKLLVLVVKELVNAAKRTTLIDHGAIAEAQRYMAMVAIKDIQWKEALQGKDRGKAIAAFQAERDSLLDTVIVLIDPSDHTYAEAKELAITDRYLLDVKRNGIYKARGVKHGFKKTKLMLMVQDLSTTLTWQSCTLSVWHSSGLTEIHAEWLFEMSELLFCKVMNIPLIL